MSVVGVSTLGLLEAEVLWQRGMYIGDVSTPPAGISPGWILGLGPLPPSLEAPAIQAARGFTSYAYGWWRGQPRDIVFPGG